MDKVQISGPRMDLDGSSVSVRKTDTGLLVQTIHSADYFENVFRYNQELRHEVHVGRLGRKRHRVKVASIPIAYYYHLLQEFGEPDTPEKVKMWMKKLNDPEFRKFRTAEGNL